MSDRPILVPDPKQRIVSPDEAKRIQDENRKYGPGGKRIRPPADIMQDSLTREEAMDHVAFAAATAVNKAMEEQDAALGDRLEQMEQIITENVLRAIERRTVRYRVRMWVRGWLTELGLIEPVRLAPVVDPVDALDPNVPSVQDRSAREVVPDIDDPSSLSWRSAPEGFTGELAAWLAEQRGVAVARHPKTGDWFLIAHDTPTLERAARMLGGENPTFEPGTTSAQLDDRFAVRAFKIIQNCGEVPTGGWDG